MILIQLTGNREDDKLVQASKQRNSNIELLRILAMFLIVMHHFAVHSDFVFPDPNWSNERLFVQFMSFGGKVGVDIFVMISGYFLVKQTFRLQKLCRLLGQCWFYLIVVVVVALVTGFAPVKSSMIGKALLPLWNIHWFAYYYVVLYLLFPFINRAITAFSESALRKLLLMLTLFWCVMPWLLKSDMGYSLLGWFVYLYLLGAYFRLYPERISFLSRHAGTIAGIAFAVLMGRFAVRDAIAAYTQNLSRADISGIMENGPYVLLISIGLFLWFEKRRGIGTIPWVNRIAATMFGVYLIHDHPLVRSWLWTTLCGNPERVGTGTLIPAGIVEVVCVFVLCSFLDGLRLYFVERPFFARMNPVIERFENGPLKQLEMWICR